jgi:hypothetical protein
MELLAWTGFQSTYINLPSHNVGLSLPQRPTHLGGDGFAQLLVLTRLQVNAI